MVTTRCDQDDKEARIDGTVDLDVLLLLFLRATIPDEVLSDAPDMPRGVLMFPRLYHEALILHTKIQEPLFFKTPAFSDLDPFPVSTLPR